MGRSGWEDHSAFESLRVQPTPFYFFLILFFIYETNERKYKKKWSKMMYKLFWQGKLKGN